MMPNQECMIPLLKKQKSAKENYYSLFEKNSNILKIITKPILKDILIKRFLILGLTA